MSLEEFYCYKKILEHVLCMSDFFPDITCSTLTSQSPNIFFPTKYLDLQYFNYNDLQWQNHSCHKIKILVITFDRLRPSFNTTGLFSYILVRRNTSKTEKKKSIIVSCDWLSTTNREHHRHSLMITYSIAHPPNLLDALLNTKQQSLTNRSDMHFFLGISDCLMMFCKTFLSVFLKTPTLDIYYIINTSGKWAIAMVLLTSPYADRPPPGGSYIGPCCRGVYWRQGGSFLTRW